MISSVLLFFILRLIPGNVVEEYARAHMQQWSMSYEDAYERAASILNYDPNENVFIAFFKYIGGVFRGNLGSSYNETGVTVNSLIKQFLPWTLFIATISLIVSFFLGSLIGARAAHKRGKALDKISSVYIGISGSIPDYLVALLLVIFLGFRFKWFPTQYNYDVFSVTPGWNLPFILDVLYHACLPILAYVIVQTGNWILYMRGSCIGVLGEDYIFAARARGLSEKTIRNRYMKKNAMLPLIAMLGISFGGIFGGAVLVESIFKYPGIGLEITARITSKDYVVVQGLIFFTSAMTILVNLVVDLIYPLIDPRVRRGMS